MDPRHPLLSVAHPAAEAGAESAAHGGQRAAIAVEDQAGAQQHDADAGPFGFARDALPCHAQLGHEAGFGV